MLKVLKWDILSAYFASCQPLDLKTLSPMQRMILAMDGTLTDVLEAYYLETIVVLKLHEAPSHIVGVSPLKVGPDKPVLVRKILLQTQASQINCLYAESIIVTDRLQPLFNNKLVNSDKPMGKLWNEQKIETFKETLFSFEEPAGELAAYFQVHPSCPLVCRSYRVFSQQQPIMLITEKFPISLYV